MGVGALCGAAGDHGGTWMSGLGWSWAGVVPVGKGPGLSAPNSVPTAMAPSTPTGCASAAQRSTTLVGAPPLEAPTPRGELFPRRHLRAAPGFLHRPSCQLTGSGFRMRKKSRERRHRAEGPQCHAGVGVGCRPVVLAAWPSPGSLGPALSSVHSFLVTESSLQVASVPGRQVLLQCPAQDGASLFSPVPLRWALSH